TAADRRWRPCDTAAVAFCGGDGGASRLSFGWSSIGALPEAASTLELSEEQIRFLNPDRAKALRAGARPRRSVFLSAAESNPTRQPGRRP
ncbi:MAG TPA: hypothetical protein VHM72_10850, partial [Solirubrobacteraceae bacterium]|nr:hypothetical protein [Solirubrobacteraceae bacterium]